ncbi:MAG: hypothetical protein ACKVS6_10845 [Planctomycetota bacterium]
MTYYRCPLLLQFAAVVFVTLLQSCTAPVRTSRITSSDVQLTVDEVVQKLASSSFLANRNGAAPEIRLVPSEVENRSSDRIPRADRWALLAKVCNAQPMLELFQAKNVHVYITEDEAALARRAGFDVPEIQKGKEPTHRLTAIVASASRTNQQNGDPAEGRKDYYSIQYQIENLASRKIEWEHSILFARLAHGLLID